MARVKTSHLRKKKHKKVLKQAKGYRMTRSRLYKVAHEAVLHAGDYAFRGRKERKRQMRRLWITRISAALSNQPDTPSYSKFIHQLSLKNIKLNRKMLSELAIHQPEVFSQVVKQAFK